MMLWFFAWAGEYTIEFMVIRDTTQLRMSATCVITAKKGIATRIQYLLCEVHLPVEETADIAYPFF